MFKPSFLVALLVLAAWETASAEWVRVGGTHKYQAYADLSTIGVTDQTATMWTMKDYMVVRHIPRGTYRSVKIKKQFDCLGSRSRPLRSKYYAEPMGRGRPLLAGSAPRKWSRVIPGSDAELEWKRACRSVRQNPDRF